MSTEAAEAFVLDAVTADPVCATVLDRASELGLSDWWLTGGAVFQNVWNAVEGRDPGYGVADYDVFYFDADLTWEAEDGVIRRADLLLGDLDAEVQVRNEARVHLWYADRFGVPAAPFASAREAIDCFAATACALGVTREARDAGGLRLHAPYGLEDVLALRLRPNPRLAPRAVYEAKVAQYRARWPALTAEPWPSGTDPADSAPEIIGPS